VGEISFAAYLPGDAASPRCENTGAKASVSANRIMNEVGVFIFDLLVELT
jgi:hypothetical protein